ncbi:peptide chain release factor N(5)-glutamine methyltransferase [Candidatus Neomarinimicrobiota bacterium]
MTATPSTQSDRQTWRIIDLINWATDFFQSHNIDNARHEVDWLLSDLLQIERVALYVDFDRPLSKLELAAFKQLVIRRTNGEPFQHIIGKGPFFGRDFKVTPDVLIPRPETELLIERLQMGSAPATILDIGTGSGCIAITAGLLFPDAQVSAFDISEKALEIAKENANLLGAGNVTFKELDFLNDLPSSDFDVVLCNPPYVSESELPELEPTVRDHEPTTALTDHSDGLTFYRRLAQVGQKLLRPGGRLIVEIGGPQQVKAIRVLFASLGGKLSIHRDLQGDERVIEVRFTD